MREVKKWYLGLNIYYRLLPFLFLYSLICILLSENKLVYDEIRYMMFAKNLSAGFYSRPYPDYSLWNGPGYPIFIVPFVFLKLPLLTIKLLNAVLLYFSLIISFRMFSFYASEKASFIFTVLLGFYFLIYEQIPYIFTECLTWFLITLVSYSFLKNYQQKTISWKMVFIASFSIAYLAMTKIIFGYVIEIMLFISLLGLLFPLFRHAAKKAFIIFLCSFILCLPWLFYTYHITHQPLYWGNSGSMSLYTMSSPYQDELGDWMTIPDLTASPNHKAFMDSISHLGSLQQDNAYKKAAIENIQRHPKKYFLNWVDNVGRLLFSFPNSNAPQAITNYYTIVPNMLVAFFILFSFILCILNYKSVPNEIIFLLIFILIYLFGSSLVSGYRRMFYVTIPFWYFFVLFALNNFVSLKIKTRTKEIGLAKFSKQLNNG